MHFDFTLHYRDELEAARAPFPHDPTSPAPVPRPLPTFGWVIVLAATALAFAMLSNSPARCPAGLPAGVDDGEVLPEPDPLDNPRFVAGAVTAGLGAALFVIPLAFVLGQRSAARPYHDKPVTAILDESGVTLRTDARELHLAWDGVVAVAETKNLFVLKTLSDLRLTLPKRALRDYFGDDRGRIDDLRHALQHRVTPVAMKAAA